MYFYHFFTAFIGLSIREIKKFSMQKGRLFSAIVRPALWLFVFAAGVGSAKGVDPGILNFYPIQNINYFEFFVNILIRIPIRLIPSRLRYYLYKFLRK